MNDREVEALRSKYKKIVNNSNADDAPIRLMKEVVDAFNKGRADEREKAINEFLKELFASDNYNDWHSICVIAERLKEQK